jgi:hypothetical protein
VKLTNDFLYGKTIRAGKLSALVAPGWAEAETLAMAEATAMALGRPLLAGDAPVRPLRVMFYGLNGPQCLSDAFDAVCTQHGLEPRDLDDRLMLMDTPVRLIRNSRSGPSIDRRAVAEMVKEAKGFRADVLVLSAVENLLDWPQDENEGLLIDPDVEIHWTPGMDRDADDLRDGEEQGALLPPVLLDIARGSGAAVLAVLNAAQSDLIDLTSTASHVRELIDAGGGGLRPGDRRALEVTTGPTRAEGRFLIVSREFGCVFVTRVG